VSVFWVLPSFSQKIDIPLPAAILVHGEPVGFKTTLYRQKRSEIDNVTVECQGDEYQHPDEPHCCKKCHAGFYRKGHCPEKNKVTECHPCRPGTFTEIPNYSKKCYRCSGCVSSLGQVTLRNCSQVKDTVCGCPPGQFQSQTGDTFRCETCGTCNNGTKIMECGGYRNTVCKCDPEFYFDDNSWKCQPCDTCSGSSCTPDCPNRVFIPSDQEFSPWMFVFLGLLGIVMAGGIVFSIHNFHKRFCSVEKQVTSSSNAIDQAIPGKTPLISPELDIEVPKLSNSISETVVKMEQDYQVVQDQKCKAQLLPDVTYEPRVKCLENPVELYAVIKHIPLNRWREFVRRLGLSDNDIESSERDNRRYQEAQYDMLHKWTVRVGPSGSTRDIISKVLREMDLAGCIERIQESL
ncbi:hypothetical protein GDO86_013612, partial [Hymenochirus boettgeri]